MINSPNKIETNTKYLNLLYNVFMNHNRERHNLPSALATTVLGLKPKVDNEVIGATDLIRVNDLHSAMYLLKIGEVEGRAKWLLFDGGDDPEAHNLIETLSEHGSDLSDIESVFVTHSHPDHIGALHKIDKDVPMFMSEETSQVLRGFARNDGPGPKLMDMFSYGNKSFIEGIKPEVLTDGLVIHYGEFAVHALEVNGHTRGHFGYLVGPGKDGEHDLILGDAADVNKDGSFRDAAWFFSHNQKQSRESVKKVVNYAKENNIVINTASPAHSGNGSGEQLSVYANGVPERRLSRLLRRPSGRKRIV